jgi:hypothetical protein
VIPVLFSGLPYPLVVFTLLWPLTQLIGCRVGVDGAGDGELDMEGYVWQLDGSDDKNLPKSPVGVNKVR